MPTNIAALSTTSESPKCKAVASSKIVISAAVLFTTDKKIKKLPRSFPGVKSLMTGLFATSPTPLKKLKPKVPIKMQKSPH